MIMMLGTSGLPEGLFGPIIFLLFFTFLLMSSVMFASNLKLRKARHSDTMKIRLTYSLRTKFSVLS